MLFSLYCREFNSLQKRYTALLYRTNIFFRKIMWSAEKLTVKFYLAPGVRNRKFYLAPGMKNGKIYLAANERYEKFYLALKGLSYLHLMTLPRWICMLQLNQFKNHNTIKMWRPKVFRWSILILHILGYVNPVSECMTELISSVGGIWTHNLWSIGELHHHHGSLALGINWCHIEPEKLFAEVISSVKLDILFICSDFFCAERNLTDEKRLEVIKQNLAQLPPAHYHTLKYLLAHLHR